MRSLTTLFAKSANFQPYYADVKSALCSDLRLEPLERRTRVFHDCAAAGAGHVAMLAVCLGLVVVLFALDVHQVQLIDQAVSFEQRNRSIDGGAVALRIPLSGDLQQSCRVEVPGSILNNAYQQAPLRSHANS